MLKLVEERDHAVDGLRATTGTGVENAYKLHILVRAVHLKHFSIDALLSQMAKQLARPARLKIKVRTKNKYEHESSERQGRKHESVTDN